MEYEISFAFTSHRGKVRKRNQDNLICERFCLPAGHSGMESVCEGKTSSLREPLFGVFDGLDRETKGGEASYIAARTAGCFSAGKEPGSMRRLCLEANRNIVRFSQDNHLETSGSTAAMIQFRESEAILCNIGDSRIYRCRDGCLAQLSTDHVYSPYSAGKPPLIQFLGIPEEEMRIDPMIRAEEIRDRDLFLLCSDGLTDMLTDRKIGEIIAEKHHVKNAAEALLHEALEAGGKDNITLILTGVRKEERPQEKALMIFW